MGHETHKQIFQAPLSDPPYFLGSSLFHVHHFSPSLTRFGGIAHQVCSNTQSAKINGVLLCAFLAFTTGNRRTQCYLCHFEKLRTRWYAQVDIIIFFQYTDLIACTKIVFGSNMAVGATSYCLYQKHLVGVDRGTNFLELPACHSQENHQFWNIPASLVVCSTFACGWRFLCSLVLV